MVQLRLLILALLLSVSGCDCSSSANIGSGKKDGGMGGGAGGGAPGGGSGGGDGVGGGEGQGGGSTGAGGGTGFVDDGGSFDPADDAGAVFYDGGCGPIDAGNPPLPRRCAPGTAVECNAVTDGFLSARGVPAARLNADFGNGFDDDCDGEVDEGCSCPGNGQTKDCYLVPATQASPTTGTPVGWCSPNAKGSLDCTGGELSTWSGVCRGASQPARHDSCASGDFNCDGLSGNSDLTGCTCPIAVTCPTQELTLAPFPPPANIPLIDGSLWIDASQRANTTGWTWTVLGGDCDNVLPFPTFALYTQPDSNAANTRKGARTPVKFDAVLGRYVSTPGEPLIAIQAAGYGNGVGGGRVHAAFGLSGDYTVQGEFDLQGQHYVCTQKVRVRAPGIRAELCWDTVGGQQGTTGNDIDLHFARLQGTSCADQGWDGTCSTNATGRLQDCYYSGQSGCPANSIGPPGWGYADSAPSACQGWGSTRAQGACTNPRLDRDNVTCNRNESNPNVAPNAPSFCGPENINLDNPKDGDRFAIAVNHFGNHGGTKDARPHVNVYCNGGRVLSIGYNPATGQTGFPKLSKDGADATGDLWTAALVTAHVANGALTGCDVATVPSHVADPTRDGPAVGGAGNDVCVDSTASQAPNPYNYASHKFVDPGSKQGGLMPGIQPSLPAQWCKH